MLSPAWWSAVAMIGACATACTPLHRLAVIEPVTAHGATLDARIVAVDVDTNASWYEVYELELHNAGAAPLDVDLAAARVTFVSLIDNSAVAAKPLDGGIGPAPGHRVQHGAPGHVTIGPAATQQVWLAFGGILDARMILAKRLTIAWPGLVEIPLINRSAENPNDAVAYRGERQAIAPLARAAVEFGDNHVGSMVPFDLGAAYVRGDARIDLHFGHRLFDDKVDGVIERTGAFAIGPGLTYQIPFVHLGVYANLDYERIAPPNVSRENGKVIDVGIAVPIWTMQRGGAYTGWSVPFGTVRFGWAETYVDGTSSGAVRIGLEIAPAWIW